jgi:hypothetical protein
MEIKKYLQDQLPYIVYDTTISDSIKIDEIKYILSFTNNHEHYLLKNNN